MKGEAMPRTAIYPLMPLAQMDHCNGPLALAELASRVSRCRVASGTINSLWKPSRKGQLVSSQSVLADFLRKKIGADIEVPIIQWL